MSHDDWDDDEDWHDDVNVNSDAVVPCPECGAELYDDADHCHQCGHWFTDADRRNLDRDVYPSRRVRIVAIGLLAMFLLSLLLYGTIF